MQGAVGSIARRFEGRTFTVDSIAPTTRSLVVALAIMLSALVAWVVARETSLFAAGSVRFSPPSTTDSAAGPPAEAPMAIRR